MKSELAQLVLLTTYYNEYIKNNRIPEVFDSINKNFQLKYDIKFKEVRTNIFYILNKEKLISNSAIEWFKYLKSKGCKYLRLYLEDAIDDKSKNNYQLAGFVGGGGNWLIEAVYDNYSNYWTSFWQLSNNKQSSNTWIVKFVLVAKKQITCNLQIDNKQVKENLNKTLLELEDFAYKQELNYWGEIFNKSKLIINSLTPENNSYNNDLLPLNNYSLISKQIFFSASNSWVFGGMGSWNDLIFEKNEDKELYERLSEKLYKSFNEAIISCVNSF